MGKTTKVSPPQMTLTKNEDPYRFVLIGQHNSFFPSNVSVSFQPVKALELLQEGQTLRRYSILPRFNPDRRYYSQAFCTEYEGVQGDGKLLGEHNSRLKELSTQIMSTKILLPKPRSSKTCWVCRREYADYLEHIGSGQHLQSLRRSPYARYISELAQKIREQTKDAVTKSRRITKKPKD